MIFVDGEEFKKAAEALAICAMSARDGRGLKVQFPLPTTPGALADKLEAAILGALYALSGSPDLITPTHIVHFVPRAAVTEQETTIGILLPGSDRVSS